MEPILTGLPEPYHSSHPRCADLTLSLTPLLESCFEEEGLPRFPELAAQIAGSNTAHSLRPRGELVLACVVSTLSHRLDVAVELGVTFQALAPKLNQARRQTHTILSWECRPSSTHVLTPNLRVTWKKPVIKWEILTISVSSTPPFPIIFLVTMENLNFFLFLFNHFASCYREGQRNLLFSSKIAQKMNPSQVGWSFLGKV